ncbi:S24 family peptidase [Lentibacter algarum]|jgi:phage repressor protein C with HTH and peptisase S24 domain|uniref:Phage repressor protein C, contains Cro/C1-type HTH and peptisase s24 domains n=1 Tax=Lentibacter algarum TaxID=576131 RepID=A0A1H3INJ4_9RHOB|nr:S24 family peptidase [Lentibacter algarum]SDY29270.1 Phage repressor protein C, contains Cro/C1-type HTH and peptisase s24 domains [Lentibacter algarum]
MIVTNIAQRLKARAFQLDMTPAAVAEASGLNRSFIYDIIRGKSVRPSRSKLQKVADVLKVDVEWLIDGDGTIEGDAPKIYSPDTTFVGISGVKAKASAGGGTVIHSEDEQASKLYHFRLSWIEDELEANPKHLRILRVTGDSMVPTLNDGDTILVDMSRKSPYPPGLFVLHDGMGLMAKRIEHIPSSEPPRIRVTSDNPNYSPYECLLDEVNIVGRIRWYGRVV